MSAISFYGKIPQSPPEDVLRDYLSFLEQRNGTVDPTVAYPKRETWLQSAVSQPVRYEGVVDGAQFDRNYERFDPNSKWTPEMLALLAFVKMNAGEAYGVEVLTKKRHGLRPTQNIFEKLERVLAQEETYHTRILVSATVQFGLSQPKGAWKPPIPLQVLIGALAHSPKALFHPILLGAEIAGVFTFSWMLKKVGEVFKNQPELRDSMEARLQEILVDEIGHIAFNRMAVGPWGMEAARQLAPRVVQATNGMQPEFRGLGWTRSAAAQVEEFDYLQLPESVRRRAFFV